MPAPLSEPAVLALNDKGCLRTDQTVDRKRIAELLIEELTNEHIAGSMDDVGRVEIDTGQLTGAIFGIDNVDLVELVKPLLSTGPDGPVQSGLANGYMLCESRVTVEAEVAGQIKKISFTTRFLSQDELVIQAYLFDRRLTRAESMANNNRRLGVLTMTRQPALAERVGTWTANLEQAFRLALNPGS
jgi:hypothetical protein